MSIISRVLTNLSDPDCPHRCEEGQRLSDALNTAHESHELLRTGFYSKAVTDLSEHYRQCPQCSAFIQFVRSH